MTNVVGGNVVWDLDVDSKKLASGINQAKSDIDQLAKEGEKKIAGMSSSVSKSFENIASSTSAAGDNLIKFGAAPTAALIGAGFAAVNFEDQMADVAKTTGITGENLDKLSAEILALSKNTRTSIGELVSIAEIGGQLGIAEKDILSFTQSIDVFNVALGKDFPGGVSEAATSIGKLTTLFEETNKLDVAEGINRAGSAINYLGTVGAGTTRNMAEFATRIGQLPQALRPTIQESLALGTLFEEAGISAEIASGGLSNFFLVAGREIGGFAAQMGITTEAAEKLLATNPTEFAVKFATSIKDLDPTQLANTFNDLKIGSQESIKVIGTLGGSVDRFRFLQEGANAEFEKATSLQDEYNTKNSNTAAEFQKLINSGQALAITIGDELLPALNGILTAVKPVIEGFAEFSADNPTLVAGVLAVGTAFTGIGFALKAVSVAFSGFATIAKGIGFLSNLVKSTGAASIAVKGLSAVFTFLAANPIVLVLAGIAAAIAFLALAWKNNWFDIRGKTKAALDFVSQQFTRFVNFLENIFNGMLKFLSDMAKKAKEFIDKINPYHRNSPSLVDNVTSGVADIKKQYGQLNKITLNPIAQQVAYEDPMSRTYSGNGFVEPTNSVSNRSVQINNYIDRVGGEEDVDKMSRELGFRFSVI